jgi:hypothetical protein
MCILNLVKSKQMRTIEVYHIKGEDQQLISRMSFIDEKYFLDMVTRLTTGAPFNSLRREREEACLIRVIYDNSMVREYYTDTLTKRIKDMCSEYLIVYERAKIIAQKKAWTYAWAYASADWKHRATLKQMGKAQKTITGYSTSGATAPRLS